LTVGCFGFVLHAHIPYVRKAGIWPFGEEWLFESMAESYIPLIRMLDKLPHPPKPLVSIGLTPVILEQLSDAYIKGRFEQYLFQRLDLAAKDIDHHRDRPTRRALAQMYEADYHEVLRAFRDSIGRDLVGAFRRLQEEGKAEILTSAATHGYLPLLGSDACVRAQISIGVDSYKRHFGRKPRGIWLPECAYNPGGSWNDPVTGEQRRRAGLEEHIAAEGLEYFIVDHHAIEGGMAENIYIERFPFLQRMRPMEGAPGQRSPTGMTTYRNYAVNTNGNVVSVFGRNERTGLQVWSGEWGYPGDAYYREFHKRDSVSGLQYWRVTDRQSRDLGTKQMYEPEKVSARIEENSDHFVNTIHELLSQHGGGDFTPIIVAPYDTELFGHWWYEGIRWMQRVMEKLPAAGVEVTSLGAFLAQNPPTQRISLPESSWGAGGDHRIWLNPDTMWIWKEVRMAERWLLDAVQDERPPPEGGGLLSDQNDAPPRGELLKQAARELLLMQSSDWEFLITTFQARDYAVSRFRDHLERFTALKAAVEGTGTADLKQFQDQDNIFPQLDLSVYRAAH
jgi:1,4-alpha-glucan branching enzyme